MKEEILSIESDLREGSMSTNETKEQLLVLFGVIKSLPSDIEIGKAISELSKIADKEAERPDMKPLNLRELEDKLDKALGKETRETLTEWLKEKRDNYEKNK